MFVLRGVENWTVSMFTHALLVVMTFLSIIGFGSIDVSAGWPSLRKDKPDNVDPLPNYSPDFESSIRKLMQKSKEQLDKGNIDGAIELADQAARISANSSKLKKLPTEVSPATTSQYARELRRKKSVLTAKQVGGTPPNTRMADVKQPSAENRVLPQAPEKILPETSSKTKIVAPTTNASIHLKPKHVLEVEDLKEPSTLKTIDPTGVPVVASKSPEKPPRVVEFVLPIVTPTSTENATEPSTGNEDPFDTAPIGDVIVSAQKQITGSAEPLILDDDSNTLSTANAPQIIPQSPIQTKNSVARQKVIEQSTQIKMHPRQNPDKVAETVPTEFFDEQLPVIVQGPKIVPQNNAPITQEREAPRALQAEPDQSSVQPQVATNSRELKKTAETDEMEDPFATEEVVDSTRAVSFMEPDGIDNNRTSKSTQSADHDLSNIQFSPENVLELKRRLDSVSALNPGEIRSTTSDDLLSETFLESNDIPPKVVKVRKRRSVDRDLPPVDSPDDVPNPVGTTVIGKTSMVKWHPVKDKAAASGTAESTSSKLRTLPIDLRGSISETIVSNQNVPTNSSEQTDFEQSFAASSNNNHLMRPLISNQTEVNPPRPQLQGSPWDNASAPQFEDSLISDAKSSAPAHTEFDFSDLAPSPPSDSTIEQTVFDSPGELFERHRRSRSDQLISQSDSHGHLDLTSPALSMTSDSESDEIDEDIVSATSTDNIDSEDMKQESLIDGPARRLAVILGVPKSTASSILGMTGIVIVIASLWLARSIVRAKTL